ncbi:MAG: hypothetical protein QMC36_05260 [Patescibacteria group bacterium]
MCKVYDPDKVEIIKRDYWLLIELGADPDELTAYFRKVLKNKGFDLREYVDPQ